MGHFTHDSWVDSIRAWVIRPILREFHGRNLPCEKSEGYRIYEAFPICYIKVE